MMDPRIGSTRKHWQGLIVLSGGSEGDIGQAFARGRDEDVDALSRGAWQALCGDRFYLEVQRTGRAGEQVCSEAAMDLAQSVRGVAARWPPTMCAS